MDADLTRIIVRIADGVVAARFRAPEGWVPQSGDVCLDVTELVPAPQVNWLYDGTQFAPPPEEPALPSPPPTSCTKLGLKRAFAEMNLWEQVKGFIASDPDRQEEWDLATELKLSDPIMVSAIQAFALSGITIDPVRLATRANELVA